MITSISHRVPGSPAPELLPEWWPEIEDFVRSALPGTHVQPMPFDPELDPQELRPGARRIPTRAAYGPAPMQVLGWWQDGVQVRAAVPLHRGTLHALESLLLTCDDVDKLAAVRQMVRETRQSHGLLALAVEWFPGGVEIRWEDNRTSVLCEDILLEAQRCRARIADDLADGPLL